MPVEELCFTLSYLFLPCALGTLNLRLLVPVNVLTYLEVPVPLTGAHLQVPMAVLGFIFRCLHWGRLILVFTFRYL